MKKPGEWRITLLGAGNTAWQLGSALKDKGYMIHQVLNRTPDSAALLAKELDASLHGLPASFDHESDLAIICVSDDAIEIVAEEIHPGNCLVVHTAGSVSMDVFKNKAENFGVFYPLQTFTRGRLVDFSDIPFLLEANSDKNMAVLHALASSLSRHVMPLSSDERRYLHLAAVFANNFSNHMFSLAEKLAAEHKIPFELLVPLIRETTAKAIDLTPKSAQTGPAIRNSRLIIKKHLDLLRDHPEIQEVYRVITESIFKQ